MKKLFLFLMVLSIASLTKAQETTTHRYEVKSGILQEVSRFNGHETAGIRYFDNYGECEALVQTMDMGALGTVENTTIVKKDKAWFVNNSRKAKEFENPTYDLSFINPTEEAVAKYNIQDTGEEEEFLGRICRKFTYTIKQGRKTGIATAWVYKGVVLKSVTELGRNTSTNEVTDFQENVEVSQEHFVVPE